MNEVLEKMLSSELLTEDTRNELLEAFKTEIEKVKADARETAITEAKEEYTLKFAEDKVELVEALDTKITAINTKLNGKTLWAGPEESRGSDANTIYFCS